MRKILLTSSTASSEKSTVCHLSFLGKNTIVFFHGTRNIKLFHRPVYTIFYAGKYYYLLLWYLCKNIHTPPTIVYSTAFFSVKYTCSTVHRLYYCLLLWYFRKIYLIHHLPPISYEGIATPETAVEKAPFFAFLSKKILLLPSIVPSEQYSYSTVCGLCYFPFLFGKILLSSYMVP
jgi:hypothetical protein